MPNLLIDILMLGAAGYGFHRYRNYWTHSPLTSVTPQSFDGTIYQVGDTDIALRNTSQAASKTVICFPGFLENQRYFLDLYKNTEVELIIINNADYHSEFCSKNALTPEWGMQNPYPVSSIEHDAYILCEVIENIASTDNIIIHGHSRGGAVVLEAAKQRPAVTAKTTALLEAPVLPKAKTVGAFDQFMNLGGYYFFPILFGFIRHLPLRYRILPTIAYPLTAEKKQILASLPHVPKRYRTAILNMQNIAEWQRKAEFDVYDHFKQIHIVIPERDAVLCRRAMLRSAQQAHHINVIETRGTNHFISVEQPSIMLTAAGLNSVSTTQTVFG